MTSGFYPILSIIQGDSERNGCEYLSFIKIDDIKVIFVVINISFDAISFIREVVVLGKLRYFIHEMIFADGLNIKPIISLILPTLSDNDN